jgi:membrane protein
MLEKLLTTPTAELGRASRFAAFQVKLWMHCARLLRVNRAGQQAAALSYQTIFGIVPLAIVMLLIFQGLEGYTEFGEKIKDFIYEQANLSAFESSLPGAENTEQTVSLTEHLDKIITKFFTGTRTGLISLVSLAFVVWAAFALLSTIEKSFNLIWHVGRGRSFLHRIINYWGVLTLLPLLIAVGIYVGTKYLGLGRISPTQAANMMWIVFRLVLSLLVTTIVLFLLYFILPNTKVRAGAAVWGAVVAALVWIAARNLYAYCVTELGLYRTVYGVLALIPVTVLWIYITWLIVLFGLQLTFTTQHLKSLDAAEIASSRRRREHFIANDVTVINIVREIAAAFEANKAPVEAEVIFSKLDIPAEFGEKILNHLVAQRLILRTSDPKIGYAPARDPADIRLSDISTVVAEAGFAQSPPDQPASLEQIVNSQKDALSRYSLKQILEAGREKA